MKFYPYRIQLTQLANEHNEFLSHLIKFDQAHFHLYGYVNKQDCKYWCAENLTIIHELPLYSQNVIVSCGMTCERITSPYFFENESGAT